MSRGTVSGHFIDGAKGPIFVLHRQPSTVASGCVLVVPAFAEEMNKCRRMVTEVTLRLAQLGLGSVVPDLYGTGDSGGDFADGDWATWRADLSATARWSARVGHPITGLLAIRLGCALATAALDSGELSSVQASVVWQPVFDGGRFLGQFLRLRIAAGWMEDRKESLGELKERLAAGEVLEVAGYRLSSRLATDLDALAPPASLPPALGAIAWLEVVRDAAVPLPPPSARLIESTRTHGGAIQAMGFPGEPFWSTTEIVVNQAIITRTVSHLGGIGPSAGS